MNWQSIIFITPFVFLVVATGFWLVSSIIEHKAECKAREGRHRLFFEYMQQRIESLRQK